MIRLKRRPPGPVYVHPWPICLIFVQMIFMYWINGLSKLFGETWLDGSSLHYVLGDIALTRFSQVAWPIPFYLTCLLSWTVLAWENLFPLLVLFKWPRGWPSAWGCCFTWAFSQAWSLAHSCRTHFACICR